VTHRCHQRAYLLKFGIDRRQYQRRLLQASRRFRRVRFRDYVYWSSAFAVGGRDWLKEIGGGKHDLTDYIEPVDEGSEEDAGAHSLHVPQTVFLRLWKSFSKTKS
jgi:hypothetical protein